MLNMKNKILFPAVAREIINMATADRRMRVKALKGGRWDNELDKINTKIFKKIIVKIGWPTISKVGRKAANLSWFLVQHADHDIKWQEKCLKLLKKQPQKEIFLKNIAFLDDRVRVNNGRLQIFGTQFYKNRKGKFGPRPIYDIKDLDKRRKKMGLKPFCRYQKLMDKMNKESLKYRKK